MTKEDLLQVATNMRRQPWLTLATLVNMTLTFLTVSGFVLAASASELTLRYLESKAQVEIFFYDTAKEEEILKMKGTLESTGLTREVIYVSQEEALANFLKWFQSDPALLEGVYADVLPASLEVKAKNLEDLPKLAEMVKGNEIVESVNFYKEVVDRFRHFAAIARYAGLGLVAFLLLNSLLVTMASLGMSIHLRGEEIGIMRLVGATRWYVSRPFVLQGVFSGLLASALTVGLLAVAAPLAWPLLTSLFRGITLPALTPLSLGLVVLGELLLGVLLGALGSWVAIRKYLR